MRPRPKDFYGPDDYIIPGDEERYKRDLQQWEKEFSLLPWWRRLFYRIFGI